jgi:hypothetical protein
MRWSITNDINIDQTSKMGSFFLSSLVQVSLTRHPKSCQFLNVPRRSQCQRRIPLIFCCASYTVPWSSFFNLMNTHHYQSIMRLLDDWQLAYLGLQITTAKA